MRRSAVCAEGSAAAGGPYAPPLDETAEPSGLSAPPSAFHTELTPTRTQDEGTWVRLS